MWPCSPASHPRATNHTNVGLAQGIADVDFGFIETALPVAIAKTAKDGQAAPKGLDGTLVTRVATGWTCWRGCISRFSKSWSGWVTLGSRSRMPKPERGAGWQASDCET